MSRKKTRTQSSIDALQLEHLEEKRMLTTSPINVPDTSIDSSSYISEVDSIAEQELVVRQFLDANQDTHYLQTGESGLRLVEVQYDADGIHNKFTQTWQGIDVYDGWVTVDQNAKGEFKQVHHQGYNDLNVSGQNLQLGTIDQMMAERETLQKLGADSTLANSNRSLVWNVGANGSASLAWQSTVYLDAPNGEWLTLVDAATNNVVLQKNQNPNPSSEVGRSGGAQKYTATDTPIDIASNTTFTSIIDITDVALVGDLNVMIDITHTFDADLDVFLIAPDGTRVELFTDVGGGGDNFTGTILDDEAATPITSGTAPFTGSFQPEGTLADFIGTPITGTWMLEVTDDAGGDIGTLNTWSLCIETTDANTGSVSFDKEVYDLTDVVEISVFDGNAVAPLTVEVTSSGGDFETVTLTDQGGGSWTGTINTDVGMPTANDGTIQVEVGDTIEVTYIDLDDGSGTMQTVMDTASIANIVKVDSTDIPVNITSNTTQTSTIFIADDGVVDDLNVQINLDHTFDADLDIFLISPDGTRVELMTDVGGAGDNFHDTTLDDEATTSIVDGSAPFTGSFMPEGNLSILDGDSISGVWTLEITDDAGGDEGVLNAWSLCIEVVPDPSLVNVEVIGPATAIIESDSGVLEAVFQIQLESPTMDFRNVSYQTVDGTATAGADYTATTGTAFFSFGTQTVAVTVPVNDDFMAENLESFTLELFNPMNVSITTGVATAEIQDNEVHTLGTLIDFGTQTSPITGGAIGVADLDYDIEHAFGWSPGATALGNADSGVGSDQQRDIAAYDTATFLVDVANSSIYEVTIEFGDNDSARETTVVIEGQNFGTVTTAAGEFIENTYQVEVADGQMTIDFTGGADGGSITSMELGVPVSIDPLGAKFLDGVITSGSLADVSESDDALLEVDPSPTTNPFKQKVDILLLAETTIMSPTSFGFRLEAGFTGGPVGDVIQSVDIWNETDGIWESLDTRPATDTESVVEATTAGDLSRFVHQVTGEVIARMTWLSESFAGAPFNWSVGIDEAGWLIAGNSSFARGSSGSDGSVAEAAAQMNNPSLSKPGVDSSNDGSGRRLVQMDLSNELKLELQNQSSTLEVQELAAQRTQFGAYDRQDQSGEQHTSTPAVLDRSFAELDLEFQAFSS